MFYINHHEQVYTENKMKFSQENDFATNLKRMIKGNETSYSNTVTSKRCRLKQLASKAALRVTRPNTSMAEIEQGTQRTTGTQDGKNHRRLTV